MLNTFYINSGIFDRFICGYFKFIVEIAYAIELHTTCILVITLKLPHMQIMPYQTCGRFSLHIIVIPETSIC